MKLDYFCICGKKFKSQKSLSAHESGCREYYLHRDGNIDVFVEKFKKLSINSAAKKEKDRLQWVAEKHQCEICGTIMTEKFGSGRFCSKSCANSRNHSKQTKEKIKTGVIKTAKNQLAIKEKQYLENPNFCVVCNCVIPYAIKYRKTCCDICYVKLREENSRLAGKASAKKQYRRSKNEMRFCELCEEYFGKTDVLHNEPIFNGWDADIIIPKHKIAILWNGPWHYRQVTKKHKLKQVQNRDAIKLKEIKECGYTPYIVKDLNGKYDIDKVEKEFKKFLKTLNL